MKGPISILCVDSLDRLASFGDQYDELIAESAARYAPVYDRAWLSASADIYFAGSRTMCFLLAFRDGALIGIAPLVVDSRPRLSPRPARLRIVGQNVGSTLLGNKNGDFIIARDQPTDEVLTAFLDYIHGDLGDIWDELEFGWISQASALSAALDGASLAITGREEGPPSYSIDLSKGWDDFLASRKKKSRSNLNRRLRKLDREFSKHAFSVHQNIDDRVLEEIAVLHTARQRELEAKGLERDAVLEDPRTKEIVARILSEYAAANRLRLYRLDIDGELAAFRIMLARPPFSVAWFGSFSSAYYSISPYILLTAFSLQTEVETFRSTFVNLLVGTTQAKEEWSSDSVPTYSVVAANSGHISSRAKLALVGPLARLKRRLA
jgi:hypothetical protein